MRNVRDLACTTKERVHYIYLCRTLGSCLDISIYPDPETDCISSNDTIFDLEPRADIDIHISHLKVLNKDFCRGHRLESQNSSQFAVTAGFYAGTTTICLA